MNIDSISVKNVNIKNFKVYADSDEGVNFNFGNNKAILITGPNGYGKTTLVEAIEWCLTGDVGRVSNCYDKRNTTSTEKSRAENLSGLFKNRNSQDKPIEVSVILSINGEDITVKRKQINEGLGKKNQLTIDGETDEEIKESLKTLIAKETYYKYNVCDTLKSYRFLTSKRQDIYELFQDFLKDRPKVNGIIERFPDIEKIIEDDNIRLTNKLTINLTVLEQKKSKLIELKKNCNKVEYPLTKIFESENVNIFNLTVPEIELQLKTLRNIGIIHAQGLIKSLIDNEKQSIDRIELKSLLDFATHNDVMLSIVLENEYYSLAKLDKATEELNDLKKKKGIFKLSNSINELKNNILENQNLFSAEKIKSYGIEIASLEHKSVKIKALEADIKNMEKGNEIISALADIAKNKKAFLLYRQQGEINCPLCGAEEKFSSVTEVNQIGNEAEKYLKNTNSILLEKKISLQNEHVEISDYFNIFKDSINNYISQLCNIHIEVESKFKKYYNESYIFINNLSKHEIKFDLDYFKNINIKIAYIDTVINDEVSKNNKIGELKKYLIILDSMPNENEAIFENLNELRKLDLLLKSLINEEYSKLEHQYMEFNLFNSKINSLKGILVDNELKDIEKEITMIKGNNENLLLNIGKLQNYILKLNKVKNSIVGKQKKLEKQELNSVGPYIFEIYKKIIRHSNIDNIKLERDQSKDGGSVLVDNSGNNILNTFSQGQLGILIIAYFFANMFRRKEEIAFKTYFMDDITNCLDDMNVYSFIDMVKHLLYSQDKVLNQFFFSTCEENIEKLFINKMESYNIGVTKVKFFDYGKFEVTT
ncbi:AAA family ATPase [Clostridium estertheticum]|uniref:AAA family ATPase n=1 Tax=Clostridium estertheticum TaxID=238834 RepID=UPI001C7D6BBC|nr:AAA family ATPase [Clostridium estertheticum]MBX4266784.1 AAA family ATPase [Clostridium estertheticum]WLC88975.1 AAA family ATPase [Clostridium estertheticum]